MAGSHQGIAAGTLAAGSNTVFTATAATTVTSFVLTNTDTNIKAVDIYIDRGTSLIFQSLSIPAGSGNAVNVSNLGGLTLDTGDILTITSDKAGVNYDLSGWVVV